MIPRWVVINARVPIWTEEEPKALKNLKTLAIRIQLFVLFHFTKADKIASPPEDKTNNSVDNEIAARQSDASRLFGPNNHQEIEETTNLLPKQERS